MKPFSLTVLPAVAALLAAAAPAQAALWTFADPTTYQDAVSAASTDSFVDLTPGPQAPGTLDRSLGPYGYSAGGVIQPKLWVVEFPPEGNGIQPYLLNDTLRLNGFTGGVAALGAYFLGTNTVGQPEPSFVTVTASDGTDTVAHTLSTTGPTFLGFVSSTGAITEITVSGAYLPTLTHLTLAVPEPEGWALMLAGLGMVGGLLRLRRA